MALLNWFASDLRIELRIQDIRLLCVFVAMPLSPCEALARFSKIHFGNKIRGNLPQEAFGRVYLDV